MTGFAPAAPRGKKSWGGGKERGQAERTLKKEKDKE